MLKQLVQLKDTNQVGVVVGQLENKNYQVQVGTETLEVPKQNLCLYTAAEAQVHLAELQNKIVSSLPKLKELLKDCPGCLEKLQRYLDVKGF